MRQLVHKAEPEVVDAVVAQGEPNDGWLPRQPESGAVEVRLREVALDPQGDPVAGEEVPRLRRSVFRPAQLRDFPQEVGGDSPLIRHAGGVVVGGGEHLPAPGPQGVGVGLGIDALMVVLAVHRDGGEGIGSAGAAEKASDELARSSLQVGNVGDPGSLHHLLQGEAFGIKAGERSITGRRRLLQENLGGNGKVLVEGARHGHRDRTLPREHLGDAAAAPDVGNQVARAQALLVHAELDRGDRIGIAHGEVLVLVDLDKVDEHIELLPLGRPFAGVHERRDPRQGGFVVGFGADGPHVDHCYTSRASMRSYSACVPTKRTYTVRYR